MEFDDMQDYGLDPNKEDFEDWLETPEGQAVAEEMSILGENIKPEGEEEWELE